VKTLFPVYSQIKPSVQQKLYQFFKAFYPKDERQNMDKYFRLEKFSKLLHPLHFNQPPQVNPETLKSFLKSQLVELEIETHAYCNRTCNFCPNSIIDRLNKQQVMDVHVFEHMIDELKTIDYSGTIKFHRYNEPLSNDLIFDRIAYARKHLPKASLGFHSNGDFLTLEKLARLEEVGTTFIRVSLYINYKNDEKNHKAFAEKQIEHFFKKLGAVPIPLIPSGSLAAARIPNTSIDAIVFVADIVHKGNDRGGALKQFSHEVRHSPCVSPFGRLFIDWSGDVLPCCNLRGDIKEHQSSILGNVKNSSLQEIYFSSTSNQMRKWLADVSPKGGVCSTCTFDLMCDNSKAKRLLDKAIAILEI